MLNRRDFLLTGSVGAAICLASPALAAAKQRLNMVRERTGETFNDVYIRGTLLKGTQFDPEAEHALQWLLRDIVANETIRIDRDLLALATRIQIRLGNAPLIITSAYRTARTNARVGGARHSRHITGQALDIKVDGMKTAAIAQVAREQGAGGIGRYRRRGFVHIDTGPRREWVR